MSPFRARLLLAIFGVLLPLLLIVVWLVTPAPQPPPSRPQTVYVPQHLLPPVVLPTGSDPASVALRNSILNGERIYQQLCHHCHGRQGKGDNNPYMESTGHKPADHTDLIAMQQLSDWEFFVALRDGVKDERGWLTMPPWQSLLTSAEMWDVIRYVRQLPLADASQTRPPPP